MKSSIFLLALAAVVALVNPNPVDDGEDACANLSDDNILAGDDIELLNRNHVYYREYVQKGAIANQIQTKDVVYRGAWNAKITAIRAHEIGNSQGAKARIVQGGIGYSYTTVRFTSQRGRGFYYRLEILGR